MALNQDFTLFQGDTIDIEYHKLEEGQQCRPDLLMEIIDVIYDEKTVDGMEKDALEEILEAICMG